MARRCVEVRELPLHFLKEDKKLDSTRGEDNLDFGYF